MNHRFSCRCISSLKTMIMVTILCLAYASAAAAQDQIEFMSGAKTNGKVLEIRKKDREVVFQAKVGTRVFKQVYPYARIHAVIYRGKRYVLNKKSNASAAGV